MSNKTRISESGLRVLDVLETLRGHSINGLSNGEIAKACNQSPATINRCLNTLIEKGFATRLDSGRYAMSVRMLQIAQAHANEISRAQDRINELSQRVQAGANS